MSILVVSFSALQRAEIAEMFLDASERKIAFPRFSALQRAEIAEILRTDRAVGLLCRAFQCSSTSRNC